MPSNSRDQQKLVFAKRGQYGSKEATPEDWKWVWNDEWTHLKKEQYIKSYKSFFKEMSPPNVSYIINTIRPEIKKAYLRAKSDRDLKVYHNAFGMYLDNYINGDINPHEVAEKATLKSGLDDNSEESGFIDAAKFILNVVRKAIESIQVKKYKPFFD